MTTLEPIKRTGNANAVEGPSTRSSRCAATPSVVLDAVQTVSEAELRPVAPLSAGVAVQPRTLLAFLTYYYATGVYASQDIEMIMRRDVTFRIVCGNEFPDSGTLRRFRRYNHDAIRQCLERIFRVAGKESGTRTRSTGTNGTEGASSAAVHCIEEAMFIDGMAGD